MSKNQQQQQQKQHNSSLKCRNCATHRFTPPQLLSLANPIQNISNNNNALQAQAVSTNNDEKLSVNSANQENQTNNQLQLNTNQACLTPVSSCESLNANKTSQQHNIAKQNESCSNADSSSLDQSNAANSVVCIFNHVENDF